MDILKMKEILLMGVFGKKLTGDCYSLENKFGLLARLYHKSKKLKDLQLYLPNVCFYQNRSLENGNLLQKVKN